MKELWKDVVVHLVLTYKREKRTRSGDVKIANAKHVEMQEYGYVEDVYNWNSNKEEEKEENSIEPGYCIKIGGKLFAEDHMRAAELWFSSYSLWSAVVPSRACNPRYLDVTVMPQCVFINIRGKHVYYHGALEFHRECYNYRHMSSPRDAEECNEHKHEHGISVCLRWHLNGNGADENSIPIIQTVPVPRVWTAEHLFRVVSSIREIEGYYDADRWATFTLDNLFCLGIVLHTVPFDEPSKKERRAILNSVKKMFKSEKGK